MKFNRVNPPDYTQIVELVEVSPLPAFDFGSIPEVEVFARETKYWRDVEMRQSRADNQVVRALAKGMHSSLRSITNERCDMHDMARGGRPFNHAEITEWCTLATGIMAWSRMWREVHEDTKESKTKGSPLPTHEHPSLAFGEDVDRDHPHLGGLHLSDKKLLEWFGIKRPNPGDPIWLEGESVYVKAQCPAQPTEVFTRNFEVFPMPFLANKYTTVTPRLKTEVWPLYRVF